MVKYLLDAVLRRPPALEAGVVLQPHDDGAVHGADVDVGPAEEGGNGHRCKEVTIEQGWEGRSQALHQFYSLKKQFIP